MDLTGCEAFLAHRYGHATRRANEAALLTHVESALSSLGFTARAAVAPTVGLAWAACRFGDDAIESTEAGGPIEAPRPSSERESIKAAASVESAEARGSTKAPEAADSIEAFGSFGMTGPIDGENRPSGGRERRESVGRIGSRDATEAMATRQSIDLDEPPGAVEPIEAREVKVAIEVRESLREAESIRTTRSIDPIEAAESSGARSGDSPGPLGCGRVVAPGRPAPHGGGAIRPCPRLVEREEMVAVLAAMPIEALRLDADSIEGFRQLSIDRIEALLPLDRDEVVARFGPLVACRLDQALGLRDEPIAAVLAEPPIEVERVFATPVASQEGVRLAVQAMLAELCGRLRRRERGAVRLRLEAERIDRGVETIVLSLGAPNRRAGHLAALLEPKLDRLDVGLGVERLTLRVLRGARLRHRQKGLGFEPVAEAAADSRGGRRDAGNVAHESNEAALELADAIVARFGEGSILAVQAVESHLPEASGWASADLQAEGSAIEWSLASRPSRLQEPPEPVFIEWHERLHTGHADAASADASSCVPPDGSAPVPPGASVGESTVESSTRPGPRSDVEAALRWRGSRHRLDRWIGPERIAEAWWRRDEDAPVGDSIVTREYWRVRLASGWWVWLFRRVVESAEADGDAPRDPNGTVAARFERAEADGDAPHDPNGTVAARFERAEADGDASRDPNGTVAARFEAAGGECPDLSGRTGRHAVGGSPSHAPVACDAWRRRDSRGDDLDGAARLAVDRWFLHGVWS